MTRLQDRTKETATTTGAGNFTLDGAVAGFAAFSSSFAVGDANIPYCIEQQTPGEWEVGTGTYVSANTLQRDTVLDNSDGTVALINFSAGTKNVFVTAPAAETDHRARSLAMGRGYALP